MSEKLTAFDKINLVRGFNDGKMKGSEKSLLFIIATHLGDNDFAWISLTTLCNESCITRSNVNINIKKLISRGYIQKILPSEGYKSCRFVINFEVIHRTSIETTLVLKQYQRGIKTILV